MTRLTAEITTRPIAIIGGTGAEGFGLALRWARACETVIIGSRDATRAQEAAEKIKQKIGAGAKVTGAENVAACASGDLVVLTIPFENHAAILKQLKPAFRVNATVVDASVPLAGLDLTWNFPHHEPAEVICHNDVAPYNMTFVDGHVSGLFDFDTASPGRRIWDLAYLAYRLAPFGEDSGTHLSDDERLARMDVAIWPS